MSIPANSIMQLSILGAYAGQRIIHTRAYQLIEGGGGAETPAAVTQSFIDATTKLGIFDQITGYLDMMSSGYTCQILQCQLVAPTRYAYVRSTVGLGVPGNRAATSTALLDAVLTMQTARAGRDQVSNFKFGPAPASDFTNGTLGEDLTGTIDAYKATILQPISTTVGLTQWVPGIWHSRVPGPTIFFDRFTNGYVQDTARAKTTRTVRRGI